MLIKNPEQILKNCPSWNKAYLMQKKTVEDFHKRCSGILENSCPLRPLEESYLSMKRNLFSTLFIMATASLGLSEEKVMFYAMANQSIRALVTGCDNILDDEYKEVIPFDVEGEGHRFLSVMKIMTADRVLANLTAREMANGRISPEQFEKLSSVLMEVLVPSGLEEHEEESLTVFTVPKPEEMITKVHYRKTGMLFESPVRLVEKMGDVQKENADSVCSALSNLGIGCQLLDDMKDVAIDLYAKKYNMVISYAFHGGSKKEREIVQSVFSKNLTMQECELIAGKLKMASAKCFIQAGKMFLKAKKEFKSSIKGFGVKEFLSMGYLINRAILPEKIIEMSETV